MGWDFFPRGWDFVPTGWDICSQGVGREKVELRRTNYEG